MTRAPAQRGPKSDRRWTASYSVVRAVAAAAVIVSGRVICAVAAAAVIVSGRVICAVATLIVPTGVCLDPCRDPAIAVAEGVDLDELIRGIAAAAAGHSPLDPRAAREVLATRQAPGGGDALSPRESEVLRMVADSHANKAIALRLGISEKTVKNHLSAVFQKIGVTDRTQAALWMRRNEGELGG